MVTDRRRSSVIWLSAAVVLLFLLAGLGTAGPDCARAPLSFAVIADVQYADQDDAGARHYRASLDKLRACVADLNTRPLAFTIQLGDIVDRDGSKLDRVLGVFNALKMPKHHVLGNHDLTVGRETAYLKLGLSAPYYSFTADRWRFVVLDCSDVSVEGGWPADSPHHQQGRDWLDRLKRDGSPNAETWNGGVGEEQLQWLRQQLAEAKAGRQRVIVFGHMPVLAAASADWALVYNHVEVAQLLESSGIVAAYVCGHDHAGGYAEHNGVHYITIQGMVEASQNAYAVVNLYDDRAEIRGTGSVPSRSLSLSGPVRAGRRPAPAISPG